MGRRLRTVVDAEPALVATRPALVAALVGIALFLLSFGILHTGPFDDGEIVDTPTYQRYGDQILDGAVPYRDFDLEYPPGALPMFALPSLAPEGDYRAAFEALVALCGVATIVLAVCVLVALGARPERMLAAAVFLGLAPLAIGTVLLTRFDLWPAMLTVGALAALVSNRGRLGLGVLALAVAAKLYPLVLLPIALVYLWRRRGGRETAVCLGIFALVLAIVFVPFALVGSDGLAASFERQTGRPLQIESLGSAALLAAHRLGVYDPTVVSSFGSQNLTGGLPDALGSVLTSLQIVAVLGVWLLFAVRRGWKEELVAGWAAALCVLVALGKVSSPQFLLWLVPVVPLVAGRRGFAASALLAVAMVLTQLWFPTRYWDLVAGEAGPVWLLVARDLVLVALAAVAVAAMARVPAPRRSS